MKYPALISLMACLALNACTPGNDAGTAKGKADKASHAGTAPKPQDAHTMSNDPSLDNPLLSEWHTPFGVPPFDEIRNEHYLPAIRAGMTAEKEEVAAIVARQEPADFANTIEALERSGALLSRVTRVFSAVQSAHSNDDLREVARVIAPERAAHRDDLLLNAGLFQRVDAVYQQRTALQLDPEQQRLLEETYKSFQRAGVALPHDAQQRLRAINGELATLSQKFGDNLLAETNDFELLVTDKADLGSLPASLAEAAAAEAKRRGHGDATWLFTLQRPSINPFLQYSPNRALRKRMFEGYALRGDRDNEHDNKAIIATMAALRAERAVLLGYPTHADYVLADNMAQTPQRALALLEQVWPAARAAALEEQEALTGMLVADGLEAPLQGWDWRYYTEKLRTARYDYDEDALRPYFAADAVRDGVFAVAGELFGIRFEPLPDLPRWHPDQQAFEVLEANGDHLGVVYLDFFARESKRGGAWMNALRTQSRLDGEVHPIVTTNFNYPPPPPGGHSLLSHTEAETLFHEFGHALHGLLSDVRYSSLSGTSVPRDYVEFPSQVLENWMSQPEVLRRFARHVETGEVLPEETIAKITAASRFNEGFRTVEYMAAAFLDMKWHTLEAPVDIKDVRAFEDQAMASIQMVDAIIPRYRSTYFGHIAGGYSAGYYSYMWSEVLDADAFEAFLETSLFDPDTAHRFRKHILSTGGTRPGNELYLAFRGREPRIEALLRKRGFSD